MKLKTEIHIRGFVKKKKKKEAKFENISNQSPLSNRDRPRAHLPQLLSLNVT